MIIFLNINISNINFSHKFRDFYYNLIMILRAILLLLISSTTLANSQTFDEFLQEIKVVAIAKGISEQTIDKAFYNLTPNPKVVKSDVKHVESRQLFWDYINRRVSQYRLDYGYKYLNENRDILDKNYHKYGVPGHVIVSFTGLESNYGNNSGNYNLIRSLATLAYDNRRSNYFKSEFIALLQLIDEEKIPFNVKGAWDGGIGNIQFMPTNVVAYGVDADKDGKIDLWNSKEDIFASAANFLNVLGWNRGQRWGREVKLTEYFDYKNIGLDIEKEVNEWQKLGVRNINGTDLPKSNIQGSIILPMGHKGPAFIVYQNFRSILRWNRSILYAISVGHLADRLSGGEGLKTAQIDEPLISRQDVMKIQNKLNSLGHDAGEADGIIGPSTRRAVRNYQKDKGMIVDGHAGYDLLQKLK